MALCESCQRFDIQSWAGSRENKIRSIPLFRFQKGAENGCSFCPFLLQAFHRTHSHRGAFAILEWVKFHPIQTTGSGLAISEFVLKWGDTSTVVESLRLWGKNVPKWPVRFIITADPGEP